MKSSNAIKLGLLFLVLGVISMAFEMPSSAPMVLSFIAALGGFIVLFIGLVQRYYAQSK